MSSAVTASKTTATPASTPMPTSIPHAGSKNRDYTFAFVFIGFLLFLALLCLWGRHVGERKLRENAGTVPEEQGQGIELQEWNASVAPEGVGQGIEEWLSGPGRRQAEQEAGVTRPPRILRNVNREQPPRASVDTLPKYDNIYGLPGYEDVDLTEAHGRDGRR